MENNGQVQKNDYGVNVLTDTTNSNNRHYSSANRKIEVIKVLTDKEILKVWEERNKVDDLELAKNWLKKQDGYATSNCVDDTLDINYSSIINFKELKV